MSGKVFLLVAGVAVAAYFLFFRAETIEHDGYRKALAAAGGTKKLVLLNFTGSDWCPPCIVLEKQILENPAFRKYAEKNLVMVEVDFPMGKPLPPEAQQQNTNLERKFAVPGYPTLVLVNARGREVARRLGNTIDGPKAMIDWIESVR